MRVLLMSHGSRGDVQPLAALAVRLRALGAVVRVCAPPDDEFADLLAGFGVPMVPCGQPMRALVRKAAPDNSAKIVAELVATHFDTVASAAEDCDVVMAATYLPAGVRSVAEVLGIPYVYTCFHPFELPSAHYPPSWPFYPPEVTDNRALWGLEAERLNGMFGTVLNKHRAALGLPLVDDVRAHVHTDRPWLAADPVLGPWQGLPDSDVVQTGAWLLPDDRPLAPELESFLDAGDPPVYVGFGSMPMQTSDDVAQVVVEAVRAQGRRVLVSRGWADLAPIDDQDDCFAVGETNHQALFRRVAAVVHHGGAGTTTAAALAGAPQVAVPQYWDQPRWAARVTELGIGAAHDGRAPTFESLSAALATALAPETRTRAQAVAGTIRTDGADVAAKLLLDTISQARPPVSA